MKRLLSIRSVEVHKRNSHTDGSSHSDDGTSNAYDSRVVVKLVRNYRSHPDILHLPNNMFYNGELVPCADQLVRESLCKWSELPVKGYPLIFHSVVGKDEREHRRQVTM